MKTRSDRNSRLEGSASPAAWRRRSPLKFIVLVFGLSAPFWLLGGWSGAQLLPGLPVSALGAFCPAVAAFILVHRETGAAGAVGLLGRCLDYKRIRSKIWFVPILLLMPAVAIASYGAMRLMGQEVPSPQMPTPAALAMLIAFFIAALGEELGWSGYLIDPLQGRSNALLAGLLIGAVWAVWHWIPLLQAHRSLVWIGWWSLGTIASRILMVWLYNNTGKSVFAVALYHAVGNLCWQLFPSQGSHWDPRLNGLAVASIAIIVAVIWGPTLRRSNKSRQAP